MSEEKVSKREYNSKYKTDEERLKARKEQQLRYYYRKKALKNKTIEASDNADIISNTDDTLRSLSDTSPEHCRRETYEMDGMENMDTIKNKLLVLEQDVIRYKTVILKQKKIIASLKRINGRLIAEREEFKREESSSEVSNIGEELSFNENNSKEGYDTFGSDNKRASGKENPKENSALHMTDYKDYCGCVFFDETYGDGKPDPTEKDLEEYQKQRQKYKKGFKHIMRYEKIIADRAREAAKTRTQ